jgi:oligopeptide transport system substrate-binding protein
VHNDKSKIYKVQVYATMLCFIFMNLVSCSKNKNFKSNFQEIRLNIHSEPPTLDPRKAIDTTSLSVIKMCFDGLTRFDSKGNPTLALASQIEVSEDQKTFTFTLKKALWSDGIPITAYDFENTWKTILNPSFSCEYAYVLYLIKNAKAAKENRCSIDEIGVKALNESTLQIELEHPAPHFLMLISSHAFLPVPRHIISAFSSWAENDLDHYIGSGPFKLKKWDHYNEILLEKNPNYWDAENVKLQQIRLCILEDENTELSMYENDQLDWAGNPLSQLPLDALASLSTNPDLCIYPLSGVYYYIFNTKVPPFNNVNMRKAFALAINRKSIIENITQGDQIPATGLIPPTMWKEKTDYFKDADFEEARRLFALALKEMNIKVSDLPIIKLSYNTASSHHKIAQAIQQQWFETFRIEVSLENKEWKVFLDELSHHQFQIARMGGIAAINDPADFLDDYRYAGSNRNYPQWFSAQFSELVAKAEASPDGIKRTELLKAAEKILIEEMPIMPIYFYMGRYLKKPYLKAANVSETNDIDLKSAYIEKQ